MNTPDQETLLRAIEDARYILGEFMAPGQRDPIRTIERLLAILDNDTVLHALDRVKRRWVLRLAVTDQTAASVPRHHEMKGPNRP